MADDTDEEAYGDGAEGGGSEYPDLEWPVPAVEAFGRTDGAAAQSQAAVLLAIGAMLGDAAEPGPIATDEDWAAMEVPSSFFELRGRRAERWRAGKLADEYGAADLHAKEALYDAEPKAAMRLVAASFHHPQPLVRVAAAACALDLGADHEDAELARAELETGSRSDDPVVHEVARVSLAGIAPDHPLLAELTEERDSPEPGASAHTSLLVHGTFARTNSWWQPGGDFHSYLLNNVRQDLYAAADRFDWSGGYSDPARSEGARKLREWVTEHGLEGLDLFCHSHGGSVAMEASQAGLPIGKLVLLSCPVHPGEYDPNFDVIRECVISIRVRLDLVILADGGGQRFEDARIRENRLPIWFKHSATHDPEVWTRHDVPSRLGC